MTSNRPYLIRALYEWIVDNDCTPHLIVDADAPGVMVPRSYVRDGKIVLNIAPRAVSALALGNQAIAFSARFGGSPMQVSVPVGAVEGIYARENGQGMVFQAESGAPQPPGSGPGGGPAGKGSRLRVIK
ncbi:MAG: ClpXP protease specificity-enhancing factor [Pseudomonadota bacterium]|jgi:stringent starvation protein B